MSRNPKGRRIDAEVDHHLTELQAKLEAEGMTAGAARAEARRRFGDPAAIKRRTRRTHGSTTVLGLLSGARGDLVHVFRGLRRAPSFTGSVVFTLALALGATTSVFSVVWGTLLRPLELRDPDRLAMLTERMPEAGVEGSPVSAGTFQDWRRQLTVVSGLGAWEWETGTLEDPAHPEELLIVQVTGNLFEILGIRPVIGRMLSAADEVPGAQATTVMISEGLWRRRFAADPQAVGRRIRLDGVDREIVGVVPAGLDVIGRDAEIFAPNAQIPENPTNRGIRVLWVVGRLAPQATVEALGAEVAASARSIAETYPQSAAGWSAKAVTLSEYMFGEIRPRLIAVSAAVALLLLVAAVNAANLLLVRAADGAPELAVRAALGAGRGHLVRVRLVESFVLGLLSGVGGLAVAAGLQRGLLSLYGDALPRTLGADVPSPAVAFGLALALLLGLGAGIVPAVRAADNAMASLGRGFGTARLGMGQHYRSTLVVAQIALTTVILVGAGLLIRTVQAIQAVDIGFSTEGLVAARISLDDRRYPSPEAVQLYFDTLLKRVRAIEGVTSAGVTSALPMDPIAASFDLPTRKDPGTPWAEALQADFRIVTAGLMETLGFRLVEGRLLQETDRGGPPVALVNRSLAQAFWPGESAVGKRIQNIWGANALAEVIGVVEDTRFYGPMESSRTEMFVPLSQADWRFMTVVAKTTASPAALMRELEEAATATDPLLPPQEVFQVATLVRDATRSERLVTILLSSFAALALILATAGVYGVLAYTVRLRTRELGVRMALGSSRAAITLRILGGGALLGLVGAGLGLAATIPSTRLVSGMLFEVRPMDPVTLAGVACLLVVVAAVACLMPALRAARLDPAAVLRDG